MYKDKVIWITGASSGIGLELTRQLADLGARIVLSARRRDVLDEIVSQLPGGASRHWVAPLDLADIDKLIPAAEAYLKEIGSVDVLINNGGISQRSLFLDTDFDVYRRLMDVNYLGTVALTKAVVPAMVARRSGLVVSVSSVAGKIGSKLRTGYSGSKYAVVGFMDCLRAELAEYDVACLTVCPGSIQTNIAINALNAEGEAQQTNDDSIINGMSVDECVRQIIKAMSKGKDEVVIGQGISGMAPTIKRFFPSLYTKLAAKMEYR